eukprot:2417789-Prymnesium_polylepis.1
MLNRREKSRAIEKLHIPTSILLRAVSGHHTSDVCREREPGVRVKEEHAHARRDCLGRRVPVVALGHTASLRAQPIKRHATLPSVPLRVPSHYDMFLAWPRAHHTSGVWERVRVYEEHA